ncbi:MAG: replicative DNA helicase [Candidatus Nomurabacteria bacterium]|jgi:replicative DNA helicase|nr:replicative DNA helicase [Candidatus Nomurabacteria bacterium]
MANEENKGKLPPQNIDAEMSVLGAVLIEPNAISEITDKLVPEDFYEKKHELIYAAMLRLYGQSSPIDLLTITEELERKKELELVGGREYIVELTDYVPSAANIDSYADIVRNASTRRRLITISGDMQRMAYDGAEEAKDIIEKAESALFAASQSVQKGDLTPISSLLTRSIERLEELQNNKGALRGVATGFADLDRLLNGLQRSELIIVGARPSMGKSTLAQNIAHYVATHSDKHVLFFSLEMSSDSLVDRLIAEASGVDHTRIRSGYLKSDDYEKITEAMAEMENAHIAFDETSILTVNDMRSKARRYAMKNPLGLIVVDYLSLMDTVTNYQGNQVQKVAEISRGLKALARELDVPVLALSQLSRASVQGQDDKRPQLQHLRDSGAVEQDADVVIFIHREDYYHKSEKSRGEYEDTNIAEIIIEKNRNGRTGALNLYFHPELLKFQSLEREKSNG